MSAKPLEWEEEGSLLLATSLKGRPEYGIEQRDGYVMMFFGLPSLPKTFDTVDAAKAHAEQLHQQAWSEMKRKWEA